VRQAVGCNAVACPGCSPKQFGIARGEVGDPVAAVDQHHRHTAGHHPRVVIAPRPHPRPRPPHPARQPTSVATWAGNATPARSPTPDRRR
jgi:hypothetical protein